MPKKQVRTKYAVPCRESEEGEVFFVAFNTRDEGEALRLASCVHGDAARKALVIINEDGEIIYLD